MKTRKPLTASYKKALDSDNESTSSEQQDNGIPRAVTEQDKAMGSEHSKLEWQIPSARPLRDPDKEQAEMELELW